MAKTFFMKFGTGDPRPFTGLSPTFLIFVDQNGATLAPPSIAEDLVNSGFYKFAYTPTLGIAFLADGGSALSAANRYVSGSLDPVQMVDQYFASLAVNIGTGITGLAVAIGSTLDSYGTTLTNPASLFGFGKRIQENLEGNMTYTKSSGILDIYTRGSSQLLVEKTIVDSTSQTTKT